MNSMTTTTLTREDEVQSETINRFVGGAANQELERAQQQADAVLQKAEAAGRKMFQRVQRVRNLLSQAVVLRHSAAQGRILAESVDPAAQARGVLGHFGQPNAERGMWEPALYFGAAIVTMRPHLLGACSQIDAEAEAIEKELKAELADGEIIFSEIAGEFRGQNAAYAAEVDALLGRLATKG